MDILKLFIPVYLIIFFLTAIILPSYLLYRRTGVNPVTFKRTDSAHDYIGFLFQIILAVIVIYSFVNSFIEFEKIEYVYIPAIQLTGVALLILSLVSIIISQKTMANSWRIGVDENVKTELVTKGTFALVRNPIFSGMLLTLISLFMVIPTYFMAYMVILSYLLISIQVRLEEEHLTKIHGPEYLEYKSKIGRFLPKFQV